MTTAPHVRLLREDEVRPAAAMLARTFVDSPLIQYVMPDRARRDATGRWMFGSNLHYGLRYGAVWAALGANGAVQGAAVWWAPAGRLLPPGTSSAAQLGSGCGQPPRA